MYNKKVLNTAIKNLDKAKAPKQSRDIIVDPRGQWEHPGEVTRIPSNIITMQGVSYPVLGIPDRGAPVMMMPGQYYEFPEAEYVDEYPQMKKGGGTQSYIKLPKKSKKGLKSKAYSKSLEATNRLFTENALFAKSRSRKRKVYDPNAVYFQTGGSPATSIQIAPYEQGMFSTGLTPYGTTDPSLLLGIQRSNMFPRWSQENDVSSTLSGQLQLPYSMDRAPGVKGQWTTAYTPNAGQGKLDFTTQGQLEAGYNPNQGFNASMMAWPYVSGSNVGVARWKNQNQYYPGAFRAGIGPQLGGSYSSRPVNTSGDAAVLDPGMTNKGGIHYGARGFLEYTPSKWLKLRLDAQGMFDPLTKKATEGPEAGNIAETENVRWKFTPGAQLTATVPLDAINRKKKLAELRRKKEEAMNDKADESEKVADAVYSPMWKKGGSTYDYIETELTQEQIDQYAKGGYIIEEIDHLPEAQSGGEMYVFNGTNYMKQNGKWFKEVNGKYIPLTKGNVAARYAVLEKQAYKLSPYEIKERARRQAGLPLYDPLMQKAIPSETTQKVAKQSMQAENLNEVAANVERGNAIKNISEPGHLYKSMTDEQIINNLPEDLKEAAEKSVENGQYSNVAEAGRDYLVAREEMKISSLKNPKVYVPGKGLVDPRTAGPWNNWNDAPAKPVDWIWTLPILGTSAGANMLTEGIPALVSRIGSFNVANNALTRRVLGSELLGTADIASKYGTVDRLLRLGTYGKSAAYLPAAIKAGYNTYKDYSQLGTGSQEKDKLLMADANRNLIDIGSMVYDTFLDYGPSSKLMAALKLGRSAPKTAEGDDVVSAYKSLKNIGSLIRRQDGGESYEDYMELDLTPEQIEEYAKGGYIIEDISVPSLNQ